MLASEELVHRVRVVGRDSLTDELPSLGEMFGRGGQLEVVNIHHQMKLQSGVPEARSPVRDRLEPRLNEMTLAVGLPVPAGVRVPVKCQYKRAHGVLHPGP